MAIDPDILAAMKDLIFIAHQSGTSSSGKGDPQYDLPVSGMARVELDEKTVMVREGKYVKTSHLVTSSIEIRRGDRIWALGANPADPKKAELIQVASSPSEEDGTRSHWEARY